MQVYIRRVLSLYENGGIVMSWLAVDKGGCEHIFAEKPCRNESNTLWICSVVYLYGQMYANTGCCYLPKGTIKKLIGRELTWDDEPVEFKEE